MNKLLSFVGLAIGIALASLLVGCQLYFGDQDNDSPGGRRPGFPCDKDVDCAAGCFCGDKNTCDEGGFCDKDGDCGPSFKCDTARSSCVPLPGCTSNDQCDPGSICDPDGCVATCSCTNDADAIRQGAGWCDEARKTCMPGTDPAGACVGAVTCNHRAPPCNAGEVPLVKDGCYTGACRAIASCEAAPACASIQHQADCVGRAADCTTVSTGHNCKKPDNTPCQAGDLNCTCEFFTFAACEDRGANATRIVFE